MVSVIVPVYNGEKYIKNIVSNLKTQSYTNFEMIFIDDGSTDDSLKILKVEESLDSRMKVVTQKNAGVSAARNTGLKHATGQYICFIDVDDEIDDNYLSIFVREMEANKVEVAFCDSSTRRENINERDIVVKTYTRENILHDYLVRKAKIGVWGLVVSKRLIDEFQLTFKEGYKYSEDMHMVWRIINSTNKVIHIPKPLYIYKENEGSAMTKMNSSRMDSIALMKDIEAYFETNNSAFYPAFKKYGVARTAWALLWQAVHYLSYEDFLEFVTLYDFRGLMKRLVFFPDIKVAVSSSCYVVSTRIYYSVIKYITRKYRS